MDIDPSLGDFMEREELAQIVVCCLLDSFDHLQDELARDAHGWDLSPNSLQRFISG
jgi:hypothetical protein